MRKRIPVLFVLCLLSGLLLAGCDSPLGDARENGAAGPIPTAVDPPGEYASRANPYDGDAAAVADGKATFHNNCAACHGESARGDGPAATSLDPSPPDLPGILANLSDGYLLWRIAEGGALAPFHSAMPAWKTILTEDQIWQVIAYLRSQSE